MCVCAGEAPPPPVYEVLDNSPLSEFITKTCYSMHPLFHQLPLKHTNNHVRKFKGILNSESEGTTAFSDLNSQLCPQEH